MVMIVHFLAFPALKITHGHVGRDTIRFLFHCLPSISRITNKIYPESSQRQRGAIFPGCVDRNSDKDVFGWQVKPLVVYDGMKGMKRSLIFGESSLVSMIISQKDQFRE